MAQAEKRAFQLYLFSGMLGGGTCNTTRLPSGSAGREWEVSGSSKMEELILATNSGDVSKLSEPPSATQHNTNCANTEHKATEQ